MPTPNILFHMDNSFGLKLLVPPLELSVSVPSTSAVLPHATHFMLSPPTKIEHLRLMSLNESICDHYSKRLTPELTRRPTIRHSLITGFKVDERHAKGGRVQ